MIGAFIRKWLILQLIIGWAALLFVVLPWPWHPEMVLTLILFEVALAALAYFAAEAEVWWKTRAPGLWER